MLTAYRRTLLCLGLLTALASCEEDDPSLSLPPRTTEGLNTLGFTADGKVWVNHGEICNLLKCDGNVVKGQLHRYADESLGVDIEAHFNDKERNISQTFQVHARGITGVGAYRLDSAKGEAMNFITDWGRNTFYTNSGNSAATLLITKLDTVHHILSGEFSGVLTRYDAPTVATEIRDGRFDAKLTYSSD